MINIGLESVIDKAVQGNSVSFKVKLYDENLVPVVAEEDIVVNLFYSLTNLSIADFSNIPITAVVGSGESETSVTLNSVFGGVIGVGDITYNIQNVSVSGIVIDTSILTLHLAERQLKINIEEIIPVKEGEVSEVRFFITTLDGSLANLRDVLNIDLSYLYPYSDAADIEPINMFELGIIGSGILEIPTYYTEYSNSPKTVDIIINSVSSPGNMDWVILGDSISTITTISEVVVSLEAINTSVYEGGTFEFAATIKDRLGNPITTSQDVNILLNYEYNTVLAKDIIPIVDIIIPSGSYSSVINISTTKNVYSENVKVFSIGVSEVSGLDYLTNVAIADSTLVLSINDEVEEHSPTNPESKDVVEFTINSTVIDVEPGEDIPITIALVNSDNLSTITVEAVSIPIKKYFYKNGLLVIEDTDYILIESGVFTVSKSVSSTPTEELVEVDSVVIHFGDIDSVLGIEQYEQVTIADKGVIIGIAPSSGYIPDFKINTVNAYNGDRLEYNIKLNSNENPSSYTLTVDNTSTAIKDVDYTFFECTDGAMIDLLTGILYIPEYVTEFSIFVTTVVNNEVGKENRTLTLILDNNIFMSSTIDNTIPSVVSVSSATGNEGTIITHRVDFSNISLGTKAIGKLSNINAEYRDISGINVYYVVGVEKVYVSTITSILEGFTFDIMDTTMFMEVNTVATSIYEADKTYSLIVGIVRDTTDLYSKTGVGTIINTTSAPDVTSISSTSVAEGSTAVITVNLSTVSNINTTKPISFGGTAQANIDYNKEFVYSNGVVNSSGMLVIPPYVSSFTISVETYNDDLFKNSIYLDVNVGTKSGKITITNEEDRPALTITNSQVIEGNYGVLTLGVTKASATDTAVDLEFDVLGQTVSITDYVDNIEVLVDGIWVNAIKIGSRYIVTIPALDTDTEIRVLTVSDNVIKGDKTLKIKANIQGVLPAITGTINIVDKDTAVVDVEDAIVNETDGAVRVPIRMSKANANSVSLNVVTEDVTADSNDYVGINTIVTFPAGSTEQFVDIVIRQDSIYEGPETFNVIIKSVSNSSVIIGKGVGVVTILDDDLVPNVASVSSTTAPEGSIATHTVSLTNGSKFPTEVDILLTNHGSNTSSVSTVVNGVESIVVNPYVANKITLSPGLVNFNVKVTTSKDGVYRGNTSYNVSANIGETVVSGVGTVTDENDRPKISISSASAREGDNLVFYVYLDKNTLVDTVMPYRLEHITTSPADIGDETFTKGVVYDGFTGNITVPKGVRAFEVIIPTVSDTDKEGLETLRIVIDGTIGIGNIASIIEDEKNENIDCDSNAIVTTNVVEIDTQGFEDIEIRNSNLMVTGIDNNYDVQVENLDELDITVAKKEYTITGDDIYIPQFYDDAPQWMKDLVSLVVDVSMSTNNMTLINDMNKMLQEFAVSYVPLNQYTQSILDLGNEDMRLNVLLETLNSNFNNGLSEANAQIISLQMTKASKDEVVAQVIQTLSAQLSDPNSNLGATVGRLDQAIVAEQTARASSFRTLTATLEGIDGEMSANAQAVDNIMAYVGINEAGASTNTGLSAYLEASNGVIGGADSQLANTIRVTAEGVESKWAYNSVVNINGVYRKSGFGLTANNFNGNGTKDNPYNSEFWIDATKLRFTNSANTGRTAPFTIDASGVTPQIKFNGVVEFSNVNGASQGVVDQVNKGQTTTINGGRITTGSIDANKINVKDLFSKNIIFSGTITGGYGGSGGIIQSYDGRMVIDLVQGYIHIK